MSRRRAAGTRAAPPPPPAAAERAWQGRLVAVVLVLAGAAAYANSLSNPLIIDDRVALVENPQIRTLWPLTVPLDPPGDTPVARRPLVNLSFAVNYALHELHPWGYHVGNLLVHLAAGLVLFGLVRRALVLPRLRAGFGGQAGALAAAAALIWMLHPIHTEIVNYVTQRTTALMGLAYLVTLYCSLRALDGRGRWMAGAVGACAAGMACKETMVTAPVVVALFDRAYVFASWREGWRRRRGLYIGLGSTWLLLWALMVSGARTSVGFHGDIGAWTYLLSQAPMLWQYFRLLVWPSGMVADYGPAYTVTLGEVLLPASLAAALVAACLWLWWRRPRAAFLPLAALILLSPTSSVVPILTEVGAERRMYLPAAALLVLAVCGLYRTFVRLQARAGPAFAPRSLRVAGGSAVAAVCLVFLVLVVERNREFATPLGLAQTSLERWPHGRSHLRVATDLLDAGRRDEAIWHIRQATHEYAEARYALGAELLTDGQLNAGIRELRAFIERLPQHAFVGPARRMIGTALALQQRYDEAAVELRTLLAEEGGNGELHAYLGEVLLRGSGDAGEAIGHLERAAALRPRDARIRNLLGTAFAMSNEYERARQHFMAATTLDPSYEPARTSLIQLNRLTGAPPAEPPQEP